MIIRIGPGCGGGLEVQRRLSVVAAVNPQPDVRETERQFVPALQLREINRAGPEGLRHDVIVIATVGAQTGIIAAAAE